VIYGEPDVKRLLEEVDLIRYSTTQGTNAICERKGPKLGLITYASARELPAQLAEHDPDVYEALVGGRVVFLDASVVLGSEAEIEVVKAINALTAAGASRIVVSFAGSAFIEVEDAFRKVALRKYPRHLLGAVPTLYGSDLSVDTDPVRRTWTALINSFLHPAMERFLYNAEGVLRRNRTKNPLLIFGNDGTSARVAKCVALKTWGSGPRGGMEGAKAIAQHYGRKSVVSMDIGGTTTDIGVIQNATVRERRWGELESIGISFPLSEIESLGVGGSSVFKVRDGAISIGPESVGSTPGPACFGQGGKEATMTDAYLLLGVLDADSYFGGNLKLDAERAKAAIQDKVAGPLGISVEQALEKMERAYEARIAKAISEHLQNPGETSLLAFGGAGPMTACGVAQQLGVKEIIVPRLAAVFSAFGIGFSDIAHSYDTTLTDISSSTLQLALESLSARAQRDMFAEGFDLSECSVERAVNYTRNGVEATHLLNGKLGLPEGLKPSDKPRVQLRATKQIPHFSLKPLDTGPKAKAVAAGKRKAGSQEIPLYKLEQLTPGSHGEGPAIIDEEYFTCRVQAGWRFAINDNMDIVLTRSGSDKS
jgi:N-methylhydantoinase A/oxoprolinase/acetone carboxylase beta subunit